MAKVKAVFHNRLANASKNTFRDRIHSHSQKKKWYVKTHTTGSDRQNFPGTLGPEIQDVDEILRKMIMRWAIGT
jgi:hypothetical protein